MEQESITFAADRPNKAYGQSSSILVPSCNGPMINYPDLASINCPLRSWLPVAALTQAIQLIVIFDVAMLSNIPNLTYLAPTTKEELQAMMHWALHQNNGPVAIRVPSNDVQSVPLAPDFDATKMHTLHAGQQVALLGVGSLLPLATAVQQQLAEQHIDATLIDPRDISDPDTTTLANLKADHQLVVTVEEASLSGGFGES